MRTFRENCSHTGTRLVLAAVALMLLLSPPSFVLAAQATAAEAQDGSPVVLPRSRQYDIKSKINGQTYRVLVATPADADPATAYPVIYVLDGNLNFAIASELLPRLRLAKAIVVGIGYPTDDRNEVGRRRYLDLTPSVSKAPLADGVKTGGADAFFRVIEEEVKPLVMARYRVDRTKQIIFGHSLGGLFVLRTLFRNPAAWSAYIPSSPSIWYNDREILNDEKSFSKRASEGDLRLKVLVTSAGDEQYRGDDPKLRAADNRMVDNASELADRLASLNPQKIPVTRVIFPGENHGSVVAAALSRALRFALPPE